MPTFNFADIITSSTANIASLATFLFPLIPIAFAIVMVVGGIKFIMFTFSWISSKLQSALEHHRDPMSTFRENARHKISEDEQNLADWHLWRKSKHYE